MEAIVELGGYVIILIGVAIIGLCIIAALRQ
jgi:hypothetical protein